MQLGIPSNLVGLIEDSWDKDDIHLYGRFDLCRWSRRPADQADRVQRRHPDQPVPETSIVQWALLKGQRHGRRTRQFNNLHEMLREPAPPDHPQQTLDEFGERYGGEKLLFSSVDNQPEEERTVRYLQQVAHDAGFYTDFCYMHEAGFSEQDGVFNKEAQLADFWFKLFLGGHCQRESNSRACSTRRGRKGARGF